MLIYRKWNSALACYSEGLHHPPLDKFDGSICRFVTVACNKGQCLLFDKIYPHVTWKSVIYCNLQARQICVQVNSFCTGTCWNCFKMLSKDFGIAMAREFNKLCCEQVVPKMCEHKFSIWYLSCKVEKIIVILKKLL